MTQNLKPVETLTASEIKTELDDELLRGLAIVAALDHLIKERPKPKQ